MSTTTPHPAPDPPIPSSPEGALLRLHIAEYRALTTRLTRWITLQYLVYSVGAAIIAFLVQARGKHIEMPVLFWGGLLALLLASWAYCYATWEILNTAYYLEGNLRKKIATLVGSRSFWGWEPYLSQIKKRGFNRFEWQLSLMVLLVSVLIALPWLAIKYQIIHLTWAQGLLAAANIYVAAMVGLRAKEIWTLQLKLLRVGEENQGALT